jgi:hypothetical protein
MPNTKRFLTVVYVLDDHPRPKRAMQHRRAPTNPRCERIILQYIIYINKGMHAGMQACRETTICCLDASRQHGQTGVRWDNCTCTHECKHAETQAQLLTYVWLVPQKVSLQQSKTLPSATIRCCILRSLFLCTRILRAMTFLRVPGLVAILDWLHNHYSPLSSHDQLHVFDARVIDTPTTMQPLPHPSHLHTLTCTAFTRCIHATSVKYTARCKPSSSRLAEHVVLVCRRTKPQPCTRCPRVIPRLYRLSAGYKVLGRMMPCWQFLYPSRKPGNAL